MVSNNEHNNDFQALSIIAFSLILGLALFAGVVYYLISTSGVAPAPLVGEQIDLPLVGGFALVCVFMSRFISNKLIDQVSQERRREFSSAFSHYRSAIIVRLALLEGPGLLACVFAMLTNNYTLLLITLFMLAMMWLSRPTETEFRERFDVRA